MVAFSRLGFPAVILVLSLLPSGAQALIQNNVRVDRFDWMTVQTEHFDVHFDKDAALLAPRMAYYLERAWKEVGDKLDYHVSERTPFYFYANHNKFEQTNIVPIGEGTGGVTEAFKNRFVIYNDGSEEWMKHVIYHEFGHVVQFNVLYGGFWKSIRLLKSAFYPLWLMEGMAEYVSSGVDEAESEMVVRDAVYTGTLIPLPELQGFSHLKPNQVTLGYKTGNAAMRFLADEYGEDKVGKLLVTMESHFDVSAALLELLGTDLPRFDFRFREWLDDRYRDYFEDAKTPESYGPAVTVPDALPQFNHAPVVSPGGETIYFFSDRNGPTELLAANVETGETESLVTTKWRRFENIHARDGRALSLSPDGRKLVFAAEKEQRDYLFFFDLERRQLKRVSVPFDQIRSPVFSPDGETLVCVGMERGFNDLYLLDLEGRLVERLTDDPQHELEPAFVTDGTAVLYSGEVMNSAGTDPVGRDLFRVTLHDRSVSRVTAYDGEEHYPVPLPDGGFFYTRSEDGRGRLGSHLYHRNAEGDDRQLTLLPGGAFQPAYEAAGDRLYYVAFHGGERHIRRFDRPADLAAWSTDAAIDEELVFADEARRSGRPGRFDNLAISTIRDQWPDSSDSPLFLGSARPAEFNISTDIFLPFFFYSTQDGLVVADVWQVSDYLGNHQFQQQAQYASKDDFVDFAGFYTYARYRPQLTVGGRVQRYYRDLAEQQLRREIDAIALASYPLDRVRSVGLGVGTSDQRDSFLDSSASDVNLRDRFWITTFAHDTVTGRYLMATRGRRLSAYYQEGVSSQGGNLSYKTGAANAVQYIPLPRESTLALRAFYGRSVGPDAQVFRLGGIDRIRGLSRGSLENKKTNATIASGELRLRLSYLDARTGFLFPDFFFKAAYLILFDDVGYGWNTTEERRAFEPDEAINSAGAGLSWPTYVLQSFQMNLTVLWAKRTDASTDTWYVTLGSTF